MELVLAAASCCGVDATRVHPLTIINKPSGAQNWLQRCHILFACFSLNALTHLNLYVVTLSANWSSVGLATDIESFSQTSSRNILGHKIQAMIEQLVFINTSFYLLALLLLLSFLLASLFCEELIKICSRPLLAWPWIVVII